MMWRFWWTNFSFENGLDFQHSNYIFYPDGVDIDLDYYKAKSIVSEEPTFRNKIEESIWRLKNEK